MARKVDNAVLEADKQKKVGGWSVLRGGEKKDPRPRSLFFQRPKDFAVHDTAKYVSLECTDYKLEARLS